MSRALTQHGLKAAVKTDACSTLVSLNIFAGTEHDSANYGKVQESFRKHTAEAANKGRAPPKSGVKYSYEGKNKDGIEVYETSDEVKALSRKERQKKFLEIMQNEYRGRTAKFIRNGHAYYATFDGKDINKNIYGDKRSSNCGYNAKLKVGADRNIFELVENAKYNGSEKEIGKSTKAHRQIQYWDYYVKTVQIDSQVYDLVANVRRKSTGDFVYSIQLRGNNTIEASAAQQPNQKVGVNKAANASKGSIPNTSENVNEKFSREPERLNELRRQNETMLAQATNEDAANENERGLIKDYKRQYDKVSGIAEKLNTARQEVLTAERSGDGNTTAKKKIKKHRTHCPVFGRGRRLRTLGLRFWRPPLYQLSYSPIKLVGLQGLEPQTDRL